MTEMADLFDELEKLEREATLLLALVALAQAEAGEGPDESGETCFPEEQRYPLSA